MQIMQRARNKIKISEDHMTLFEKITQNKEALAEYLLQSCDNPLSETNEDMCDFCDILNTDDNVMMKVVSRQY